MPIQPTSGGYRVPLPPPSNGNRSQLTNIEKMALTDLLAELDELLKASGTKNYDPEAIQKTIKALEDELQKILDAKPSLTPWLQSN